MEVSDYPRLESFQEFENRTIVSILNLAFHTYSKDRAAASAGNLI